MIHFDRTVETSYRVLHRYTDKPLAEFSRLKEARDFLKVTGSAWVIQKVWVETTELKSETFVQWKEKADA